MLSPVFTKKPAHISVRTSCHTKETIQQAAAKRAVEIAIEQDEAAGMAYLAREGALA